jgi:hypothetical protein
LIKSSEVNFWENVLKGTETSSIIFITKEFLSFDNYNIKEESLFFNLNLFSPATVGTSIFYLI